MYNHSNLIKVLIEYESECEPRIGHFLKVFGYAKAIGELEKVDSKTQFILETAALMHDVGIKESLIKYGNSFGKNQEKEGAIIARPMLESLGYENDDIDRICFLIAHHHTFDNVEGLDYQILVEADFLVNFSSMEAEARKKYVALFDTKAGKHFLKTIYSL